MYSELQKIIEQVWENRELLKDPAVQQTIREVVELVDKGQLRTAEPVDLEKSLWQVNEWVKKAIILYFPIQPMRKMEAGELEWFDKMDLKHGYDELGVRVVPQAVARYGAYIASGAILMPSYVNIGAYVDTGTMVDTWATVGSCAQIGKHVHLSGGVGIGGVLEPVQAAPVIIEDNCFIGSRSIVVEGAHVCREAVLGSNTVITGSTHIIDVTGPEPQTYKGYVPPRSVVVPGSYRKQFPAGEYSVYRSVSDETVDLPAIQALAEQYGLAAWYGWDETAADPDNAEWFQLGLDFGESQISAMGTAHPEGYDGFRDAFLTWLAAKVLEVQALPE